MRAMVSGIFAAALLVGVCVAHSQAAAPAGPGAEGSGVNVRQMGAVGDGKADDTAAFEKALERAASEQSHVVVPRGKYAIKKTLTVDRTAIVGSEAAAWPADAETLPSILPAQTNSPAFELLAGGSLLGLDITYHWESEPTTGSAAVWISGVGATIRNVRIREPWDGIMADGKTNIGRANLENIFMVTPRHVGVRLTGTWDVPRLSNIEIWNSGAPEVNQGFKHGVGFLLGKNDLIRLTDCFVFGMDRGFLLQNKIAGCEIEGETWGVMNGCSTDFCTVGIDVQGTHTLSVAGGSFWDHSESVKVGKGASRLRVTGSELKSNGAPAVRVLGGDQVVVSGCSVLRGMPEHPGPAVSLEGGRTTLGTNHIEAFGPAIEIGRKAGSALIQGNTLSSHGKPAIVDQRTSASKVLLEQNLVVE